MTTPNIDEDIAEVIISHFPNASRDVMQEMLIEIKRLVVGERIDELKKLKEAYFDGGGDCHPGRW